MYSGVGLSGQKYTYSPLANVTSFVFEVLLVATGAVTYAALIWFSGSTFPLGASTKPTSWSTPLFAISKTYVPASRVNPY